MADSTSVFLCKSAAETVELGHALSSQLKAGDVVAFYGDLGAGKTTMIKGVAAGLGVAEVVKSPSFVMITEYRGRVPVYHIDLYRLGASDDGPKEPVMSSKECEALGFEDYLSGDGICLIEWAERAELILPQDATRIRMSVEGSARRIDINGLRAPIQLRTPN